MQTTCVSGVSSTPQKCGLSPLAQNGSVRVFAARTPSRGKGKEKVS